MECVARSWFQGHPGEPRMKQMSTYTPRHAFPPATVSRLTPPPPREHKRINASWMRLTRPVTLLRAIWRGPNAATGGEKGKAQVQIIRPVAEHRSFPMSFIPQIIQFSRRPGCIAYYITVHLISKDTLTTPLGNNDTSMRCVLRWRSPGVGNVCVRPAEPLRHD